MSRARDRWLALGVLCASLLAIVVDTANFVGYVLWSVWLIALAIVIVRGERRATAAQPSPSRAAVTS